MEKKNKLYNLRVSEEELKLWKEAALDQRYMNLSEFIRDAITEKIEFWEENQDSNNVEN